MNPSRSNEAENGNPLRALYGRGQSVWLDYIRRNLITSGELQRLIDDDGLCGITSNPSIFQKAITGSTDYAQQLAQLRAQGLDARTIYETLAIRDIQDAADLLQPVYRRTQRRDGYVSFEVAPDLAHDTGKTVDEARRLWHAVARDNLMIKVPATPAGLPAIRQLIADGINVNVTLIFAEPVYEAVAEAYLAGLEQRTAGGGDISGVASVASVFVSRIDTAIDALVGERIKAASDDIERALLGSLLGKVAVANAGVIYQRYLDLFGGERWRALSQKGGQTQRVLWASTSTKNPALSDVFYVESLIAPDTVNTMPPATMDAFRDHGQLHAAPTQDAAVAQGTLNTLAEAGISLQDVTGKLLSSGVALFEKSFRELLDAVAGRDASGATGSADRQSFALPEKLAARVQSVIADWERGGKVRRLWARDATLWTGADEGKWLAWLAITDDQLAHLGHLNDIAAEAKQAGFRHVLVLGMGGSSLCPDVMSRTFGVLSGYPALHVLDSTDPAQIIACEKRIELDKTLFIVSSKSGTTLEPNIFKQYFFERVKQVVGAAAGSRFIAITDPGSALQKAAEADGFRHVFFGVPGIGGRYSALSNFGMVPAATAGIDVIKLLDRAEEMVHACAACVPAEHNPGLQLGAVIGAAAVAGRDKLTLVASPRIAGLGAWLEQLVAESTGKDGKGIIPVDGEQVGLPDVYGNDRLFAYLRFAPEPDAAQDAAIDALRRAGQPVVTINVRELADLGREFFRWEFATAVAGSIIGINAFNQPDVEASKVKTRALTAAYEKTGKLPAQQPLFEADGLQVFADSANHAALGNVQSLDECLGAHLQRLGPGDYFALLAYVEMNPAHDLRLQAMRRRVRDRRHVATCVGFGPRFLHSTGQAYKGGPASGVFLQITCDDAADVVVPGSRYSFGVVKAAQAQGDLSVLESRGRRTLRVHVSGDVETGLAKLEAAIGRVLK
jgi:transaldolase/glucose-6-phosphate isomerase